MNSHSLSNNPYVYLGSVICSSVTVERFKIENNSSIILILVVTIHCDSEVRDGCYLTKKGFIEVPSKVP